jgi:hypothetical protein
MERSGRGAPSLHDHGELRELVQRDPPFVTVWANRSDPTPRSAASRSRSVRDAVDEVLPQAAVDELSEAVAAGLPAAEALVAIANKSGVLLLEHLPAPLRQEAVITGSLPALAPVIEHRQSSIPFIVVLVDRRGADLFWSDANRSGSSSVSGDDTYIRKVQAGGWSHRTFQQRAENTWEHTAEEVAEEVVRLVERLRPRVITVAGDVRMTEMLHKRLPALVADLVRDVPGGRANDGSGEHREEEVQTWIRTAVAEDTVAVLRLFEQEKGQLDRASDGAEATFEAIREARVDTLLIHDDPNLAAMGLFVPEEPSVVSLDRETLEALGRFSFREARLADVAIRSCVLTGAGIRSVPAVPYLTNGIGAILRW